MQAAARILEFIGATQAPVAAVAAAGGVTAEAAAVAAVAGNAELE
jgi:hypothetical protein